MLYCLPRRTNSLVYGTQTSSQTTFAGVGLSLQITSSLPI